MPIGLERIEALAPDQASLSAARKLLKPSNWPTLACDDCGLAWGEAQGSGSTPYRVVISEADTGYKCSCPSRKFPCKHSLALMWLRAEGKVTFAQAEPPTWVQEWLGRRRGPSGAAAPATAPNASIGAAIEAEAEAPKPEDPKALARAEAQRAKNLADREAGILAGLDELDLWLQDQLERGIGAFVPDAVGACRKMAQRLVDAKAIGLATRLDSFPSRLFALPEALRPRAAVEELGLFHLLAEAYRRQDTLEAALRDDIRQMIGWSQSREALLGDTDVLRVGGRWHVFAGRNVVQPDKLRRVETWLIHDDVSAGPRYALLLDYVPVAGGASAAGYLVGDTFQAELVFYGATVPLRALVGAQTQATTQRHALPPLPQSSLADAYAGYQAALTARPWLGEWPLAFRGATVRARENAYFLRDAAGDLALPLDPEQAAALWSLTKAPALDGIGLWDGHYLRLMQAQTDLGRWVDA